MQDDDKRTGFLILRAFLAQFWVLQFYFKIHDEESGIIALRNLGIWASHMAGTFAKTPLPAWMVVPYANVVPWLELFIGLLFVAGFKMREALVAGCLLMISLDIGLMLQGKHEDVARNMLFLFAMLLALQWERYGRVWSIDKRS
jgi:thiosulfate dehydrogenase [quinone] large subunit